MLSGKRFNSIILVFKLVFQTLKGVHVQAATDDYENDFNTNAYIEIPGKIGEIDYPGNIDCFIFIAPES